MLAVFFGESAFTFDQAPFRNSALTYSTTDPNTGEVTNRSVAQDLLAYLAGETGPDGQPVYSPLQLQALTGFIEASANAAPGVIPNEGNVTDINVQGEVLSELPLLRRIGSEADIPQQNNMLVSMFDLHSQALLTAFLAQTRR